MLERQVDTVKPAPSYGNCRDKVLHYKAGKEALFGFFVGQTMKAMAGKANPGVVNKRLKAKLS